MSQSIITKVKEINQAKDIKPINDMIMNNPFAKKENINTLNRKDNYFESLKSKSQNNKRPNLHDYTEEVRKDNEF